MNREGSCIEGRVYTVEVCTYLSAQWRNGCYVETEISEPVSEAILLSNRVKTITRFLIYSLNILI